MSRPPFLGHGVGLRRDHFERILDAPTDVDWFEAISENFMGVGGRARAVLDAVREKYPVVLHGVSLSIGSTDPLDLAYLDELRDLAGSVEPAWVSDHLCWTGVGGKNAHDLLPLPYTEEALRHVVDRVARVQERLKRRIALENVSSYMAYRFSQMPEGEFLARVAEEADCGILLDVNNVYVSSVNHGFDPHEYLAAVPPARVWQFHVAGHSHEGQLLLDTHDHEVPDPVWKLYEEAVRRFAPVSTLIEWDDRIPPFETLEAERNKAAAIYVEIAGVSEPAVRARVAG
ncbi:MAG TPA: DUF692 domain-containing protein [Thermoanaerobaculia bacterium]|nr:DUF692 domain-containing protein [Thermoanaerobaculia bacterium]